MSISLRSIVVDQFSFVYGHQSGVSFKLHVFPKLDKTTKVTLIFTADPPDKDPFTCWTFYEIAANKKGEEVVFRLGRPRYIAEIIRHLHHTRPELWASKRTVIIEDAWSLLAEMGYSEGRPIWKGNISLLFNKTSFKIFLYVQLR